MRFQMYGGPHRTITIHDLYMQCTNGLYFARIEQVGGPRDLFIEVAIWCDQRSRWERYCYFDIKENSSELPDGGTDNPTIPGRAKSVVDGINRYSHCGQHTPFIHNMPSHEAYTVADIGGVYFASR